MNLKLELVTKITRDLVPDDLVLKYMMAVYPNAIDFWTSRKALTQHFALATFMCYIFAFAHRFPSKYLVSLQSSSVTISEVLPSTLAY